MWQAGNRLLIAAFLLLPFACAQASSVPLESSQLSLRNSVIDASLLAKGTCISLDSLHSALQPAARNYVLLSFIPSHYPVHILGGWGSPRQEKLPAILLFFQQIFSPNRSPCQDDCSAQCKQTYGCPVFQDASRKDD